MKPISDTVEGNRPFASVTLRGITIVAVIGDHGPMIVGRRETDGSGLRACYFARGTRVMMACKPDVAAGGWMIGDPTDAYLTGSHVGLPGWNRGDAEAATRLLGIPGIASDVIGVLVGLPAWSSLADAIAATRRRSTAGRTATSASGAGGRSFPGSQASAPARRSRELLPPRLRVAAGPPLPS